MNWNTLGKKILVQNSDDSIETKIIKESQKNVGYMLAYEFNPTEIMAEITAYRKIVEMLRNLNLETTNLFSFIKLLAVRNDIEVYHQCGGRGPTLQYLEYFANETEVKKLRQVLEQNNLSLNERVLYGLEISRKEYEEMVGDYAMLYNQLYSSVNKAEDTVRNK